MKRLLGTAALVLLALVGHANAALITVNVPYLVEVAVGSVVPAIELPAGSVFTASATFDDSVIDASNPGYDAVVIPGAGPGTFGLGFGPNFTYIAADDNFGGPELRFLKGTTSISELYFEALLSIASAPGTGDYLLSFSGNQFQLTPSGNTTDFVMSGMAVPEPSSYLLFIAGLGALAAVATRRRKPAV